MKVTIKLRGQDKPVILDNIQVAQQRSPMYLVACGETHYRFSLDCIERITEEGVKTDPTDIVSASEPQTDDTSEPQTDDTIKARVTRVKTSKAIDNDISRLAGAFEHLPETYGKTDIAKRIQERLGVKPSMSYRILRRLEEAGKIRQYKNAKHGWQVVDPILDPELLEIAKMDEKTIEEYIKSIEEDFR